MLACPVNQATCSNLCENDHNGHTRSIVSDDGLVYIITVHASIETLASPVPYENLATLSVVRQR